jgi:hypothetical protein
MLRKHETIADYEGVGVYERLPAARPVAEEYRWGVYAPTGIGVVPGEDELLSALTITDEVGGLVAIRHDKQAAAVQTLDMTHFAPDRTDVDPLTGQASFVVVSAGGRWVDSYVSAGYMVMVNLSSVATMNPRIMMTRSAETISQYATRAAGYAMVKGPPALAEAALRLKQGGSTVPGGPCPAGSARPNTWSPCAPLPPTPGGTSSLQPAQAKAPSWLLPLAIGAAVVTVGAFVLKR